MSIAREIDSNSQPRDIKGVGTRVKRGEQITLTERGGVKRAQSPTLDHSVCTGAAASPSRAGSAPACRRRTRQRLWSAERTGLLSNRARGGEMDLVTLVVATPPSQQRDRNNPRRSEPSPGSPRHGIHPTPRSIRRVRRRSRDRISFWGMVARQPGSRPPRAATGPQATVPNRPAVEIDSGCEDAGPLSGPMSGPNDPDRCAMNTVCFSHTLTNGKKVL